MPRMHQRPRWQQQDRRLALAVTLVADLDAVASDDPVTVGVPGPHHYPLAPAAPRSFAAAHRSCAAPGRPRSSTRPGRAGLPLPLPGTAGPPAQLAPPG